MPLLHPLEPALFGRSEALALDGRDVDDDRAVGGEGSFKRLAQSCDVVAVDENLWPDDTLYRPWPNVQSVPALLDGNALDLAGRPTTAIWGLFGEPTPSFINYITGALTISTRNIEMWRVSIRTTRAITTLLICTSTSNGFHLNSR